MRAQCSCLDCIVNFMKSLARESSNSKVWIHEYFSPRVNSIHPSIPWERISSNFNLHHDNNTKKNFMNFQRRRQAWSIRMNFNGNVSPWQRVEVNSEQNLIKLNVMRNLELFFDLHYPSPSCQPTAHSTRSFSASHLYIFIRIFHIQHPTSNSFLRKWKFQSAHKSQLIPTHTTHQHIS